MANRKRKKNENFFDMKLFGHEIQKRRQEAGYSNVAKFSEAIQEKTGSDISDKILANIEGSASRVSIEDLMAICWTLYECNWNDEIASLINHAMFADFQYNKIVKKT